MALNPASVPYPLKVGVKFELFLPLELQPVKLADPVLQVDGDPVNVHLVAGLDPLYPLPVLEVHHLAVGLRYPGHQGGNLG